tara:strand:- start:6885 stop:8306 length:1422 start_codon:yes stop_codon:yes gene_type:complete
VFFSNKSTEPSAGIYYRKLIAGPLAAVIVFTLLQPILSAAAAITAAITLWCVLWWILEPIPIPVTSLIPIALFPLFGVLDAAEVAQAYGSPLILLMLGGFILSKAMESTGTHRRLALYMVSLSRRFTGSDSDSSIVIGFMLASAVLSMWISNTATTLMLLPIALAVIEKSDNPKLPLAMMLGIAYAANVGGMGTPIGTPPNLVFMQSYFEATGKTISFVDWMKMALPVVLVFLPLIAWWLTREVNSGQLGLLNLPQAGQWRVAEKRVLMIFLMTALAWITRSEPFGGWSQWLGVPQANDAVVALSAVIVLFIVPDGKGKNLLTWQQASDIPWGILLLFAGGICIAKAFVVSGLSVTVGEAISILTALPLLLMLLILCFFVSIITEATSNMATTLLLMPILAATALVAEMDPKLLMLPATLSASCAFMLPVATAPNAIAFASGRVPSVEMLKTGIVLNIWGAFIIAGVCYFLVH